jgi:hypothetical protein
MQSLLETFSAAHRLEDDKGYVMSLRSGRQIKDNLLDLIFLNLAKDYYPFSVRVHHLDMCNQFRDPFNQLRAELSSKLGFRGHSKFSFEKTCPRESTLTDIPSGACYRPWDLR